MSINDQAWVAEQMANQERWREWATGRDAELARKSLGGAEQLTNQQRWLQAHKSQNPTAERGDKRALPQASATTTDSQAKASATSVGIIPGSLREARSLVLPHVCDALGGESFDGLEVQGHRLVLLWPNGPTLLLTQSELAPGWHETFRARLANAQQYAKHKAKQITEAAVARVKAWKESGMADQANNAPFAGAAIVQGPDKFPAPMPQSAQTSMIVDELTDKIMGLINSKPRSPTKDEIAEVITGGIGKWVGNAEALRSTSAFAPFGLRRVYCGPHHASDGTGAQTIGMVYPDGWYDQDGKVAAFARFVQFQGPPQRYYELGRGDQKVRYEYQTFAWKSADPTRIVARMAALGDEIEKLGGEIIVWRSPPELIVDASGVYRFFCRFLLMPCIQIDGAKPEDAETPEA
jgi:hypothetical protein